MADTLFVAFMNTHLMKEHMDRELKIPNYGVWMHYEIMGPRGFRLCIKVSIIKPQHSVTIQTPW